MNKRRVPGLLAVAAAAAAVAAPAAAQNCNRSCLEGWVDRYLDAVVDNDPSAVPLADDVRFTENGQQLLIGDGLWRSMRAQGPYRLFVSDVPAGQVAFLGTIEEDHRDPERGEPALIALRLKIEDGEIAEVEQFVARNAEAAQRVNALGEPHPVFTQPIPREERMSRIELIETANKYFTGMQQNDGRGDYPGRGRAAAPDRGRARACALRLRVGVEQLRGRDVGRDPGRDDVRRSFRKGLYARASSPRGVPFPNNRS